MNATAIYSKSGKGVQEASGKTSLLKRADRAVLSAIDGRATVSEVAQRVGKPFDGAFQALIRQLEKDGFIREVSAGAGAAGGAGSAKAPSAKAPASGGGGSDLDFTTIFTTPPAAAKPPADDAAKRAREQEQALYKARQEAEARAQQERDRARGEMEAKARAEAEAKFRAEAEKKVREEAEARIRAEAEAKAKAAREAAVRLAAEAKAKAEAEAQAKIEAERKAREEAERKAREEAEKARREAEELRQRLEEERKAREAEDKRRREEEELRRKEEEERRAREEAERKAREEAERKAREEAERKAREAEEKRRREEEERRRREEEEAQARKAREEQEAEARRAREEEEARKREKEEARQPEEPKAEAGGLDALLSDIDSFAQREEEEARKKQAEEAARKARKEAEHKAEEERRAKEEAERERRAAEERKRKEEEERRAREEEERRAREEEERVQQAARERKRQAAEAAAAAAQPASDDDIGVTEDDLDMDDVRQDEAAISKESRKEQREREREARQREKEARQRERAASREPVAYQPAARRRPRKWGKTVAVTLAVLLAAGIGALHVMPVPPEEYERAASQAIGRPVKIDSMRLSLFTGVRLDLSGVTIGDSVKIASARAYPAIGSLFGEQKAFDRIEVDGITLAQQALGGSLFEPRIKAPNFSFERVVLKQLKLMGPLELPVLEAEGVLDKDGTLRSATLTGPEGLYAKLALGKDRVEFDATATSFTLPFAKDVSLGSFAMKGSATRQDMRIESWGGTILDGAVSGTANVRWGGAWQVDGSMTARGINAAVFAPALLSKGKADGTGKFSMSGAEPAALAGSSRIEGTFTVEKGVLGGFDLSRAIQTGGRQAGGRTEFSELSGQATYDRGAVALRNVSIGAGALQAGASADIARGGALSGRVVADIKTASQALRTTLVLGGTVKDPQVRN